MDIKLVKPTLEWKDRALDYRKEHFDSGEFIINGRSTMKKCLCLLFFMVLNLTFLSGCVETTDWEPTAYETVNNFDGVNMSVNKETISSTGLTVVFENLSDSQCIYSEDFLLEKKIHGNWYQVPVAIDEGYGFDDIGYNLASGENGELNIKWDWLYGSLDTGEYRIVKNILDFRSTGDYDQYKLAAEFTIWMD